MVEASSHEYIKKLARKTGADRDDLIAMACDNDPFYIGTPRHKAMAQWFLDRWTERGFLGLGGVHLRRAHYQLLGVERHDGKPYENDTANWQYLISASRFAR